jgi:transposase
VSSEATGVRPWTRPYLIWVAQLRFTQIAQEATRQDYLHEVEHMRERVARLEQAITEAVKLASPALQQVINDLQALRGIADISAVTIAAELGQVSRFGSARQLMGYCGAVPSGDSSGKRTRRGGITKTGNAHSLSPLPRCSPVVCAVRSRYMEDDDSSMRLRQRFVASQCAHRAIQMDLCLRQVDVEPAARTFVTEPRTDNRRSS